MAGWKDELERWLMPFLDWLGHKTRQRMCPLYVAGLIGPGDRKSVQPMAERLATGIDAGLAPHVLGQMRLDLPPLFVGQPKQIAPHRPCSESKRQGISN